MVHITNGSSAAGVLRAAGLPGEVLTWDDVLHDGPVPPDISFGQLRAIRAQFISDCGWRTLEEAQREFAARDRALERALDHDEVVLWFEHDLYDQLQLLQLLDWFDTCELGTTKLTLVCGAEYLGQSTPERLRERFPEREPVKRAQFDAARRAWASFRAEDPRGIEDVVHDGIPALPFAAAALHRHLEQFPSVANGLSRSQQQVLEVIDFGVTRLDKVFVAANQKREDPVFLGDSSFAMYLASLSNVKSPLLLTAQGATVKSAASRAYWQTEVELTADGRRVLAGSADHVTLNGIDRWLGGVHLFGEDAAWRWDAAAKRVRAPN